MTKYARSLAWLAQLSKMLLVFLELNLLLQEIFPLFRTHLFLIFQKNINYLVNKNLRITERLMKTHNKLMLSYEGADGIKTG